MDVQALAQAECQDEQVNNVLEKLAEEMKLFELEKQASVPKSPIFKLGNNQEKQAQLRPPGVNFFTKVNHHLYTADTLIWETNELENLKISCLKYSEVKWLIQEGLLQQEFSSRSGQYITRFVFHILASTTDDTLRYQAYNTLCHLAQTLDTGQYQLHLDFYLALDNLGADMSTVGRDVSKIHRAMIPPPPAETHNIRLDPAQLRDTLRLMLQFLSMILASNSTRSEDQDHLSVDELNELTFTLMALGLDTKFVECGLDHHIANCITHCLASYPSKIKFNKNVQSLVEQIVKYCNFEPHNVSYVCCRHVLPSPPGCILKASLAFLQVQICLQSEEYLVLDIVELKDIARVVEERQQFLLAEKNGYLLYFIIKLLDCCVYQEVLSDEEKKELSRLVNLLDVVVARIRDNVDDINLTLFRFYSSQVLDKWRRKMGLVESEDAEFGSQHMERN